MSQGSVLWNAKLFRSAGSRCGRDPLLPLDSVFLAGMLALACLGLSGCCGEIVTSPSPPASVAIQLQNFEITKRALIQYHDSGIYERDIATVTQEARFYLERQVPIEKAAGHTRLAAVFDIDETSLSNWPEMVANQFAYIADGDCDLTNKRKACGATQWERQGKDEAIGPVLDLYKAARAQGIDVFFVTGRAEDPPDSRERPATAQNLRDAGYVGWHDDQLILKPASADAPDGECLKHPDGHPPSAADYKSCERVRIEAKGYTILFSIGDQLSDLAGGHAERTFLLPNPFYFIP